MTAQLPRCLSAGVAKKCVLVDQTTMIRQPCFFALKKKKVCFGKVFLFLDRIIEKPACVAGENELDLVH